LPAYFGAPDDRVFKDPDGDLRQWPLPGGYRFFVTRPDDGDERIGIQTGKVVELQLTGAKDCRIEIPAGGPVQLMPPAAGVDPTIATSDKYRFKLSAVHDGHTTLSALNAAGKRLAQLDVVVGSFEKHPAMSIDLIAQIGQGSDSLKIRALQSMLNNRWLSSDREFTSGDNIYEQNSWSNYGVKLKTNLTCGLVAVHRAEQIFGIPPLNRGDDWYRRPVHEPLRGDTLADRSDVKYRSEKITAMIAKIVSALNKGQAVPVAVLDSPVGMMIHQGKLVAYETGGHSVTIVGCNDSATQFLYIDPWGGGSWMEYKGIPSNQVLGKCVHLGLFDVIHDPARRATPTDHAPNMIRGSSLTEFTFNVANGNYLEVISARL
jgi:hypothetical protein